MRVPMDIMEMNVKIGTVMDSFIPIKPLAQVQMELVQLLIIVYALRTIMEMNVKIGTVMDSFTPIQ